MTNQAGRQAAVRAITSTTHPYEGDFSAMFDGDSIGAGPFNQRLLAWINTKLSATYTDLPSAQHALAVSLGAADWNSLNTWEAIA